MNHILLRRYKNIVIVNKDGKLSATFPHGKPSKCEKYSLKAGKRFKAPNKFSKPSGVYSSNQHPLHLSSNLSTVPKVTEEKVFNSPNKLSKPGNIYSSKQNLVQASRTLFRRYKNIIVVNKGGKLLSATFPHDKRSSKCEKYPLKAGKRFNAPNKSSKSSGVYSSNRNTANLLSNLSTILNVTEEKVSNSPNKFKNGNLVRPGTHRLLRRYKKIVVVNTGDNLIVKVLSAVFQCGKHTSKFGQYSFKVEKRFKAPHTEAVYSDLCFGNPYGLPSASTDSPFIGWSYNLDASKDTNTSVQDYSPNKGIKSPPGTIKRRVTANRKERRRTLSMDNAFQELRDCLFNVPPDTKVSKIKKLRLATNYISHLLDFLPQDEPTSVSSLGGFKNELLKLESREQKRKAEVV